MASFLVKLSYRALHFDHTHGIFADIAHQNGLKCRYTISMSAMGYSHRAHIHAAIFFAKEPNFERISQQPPEKPGDLEHSSVSTWIVIPIEWTFRKKSSFYRGFVINNSGALFFNGVYFGENWKYWNIVHNRKPCNEGPKNDGTNVGSSKTMP